MAWSAWYTSFSDAFKKRAGRYLINKYLGTFLDETVSLDQLSVGGDISLSNVALNIRTINSLIDSADLPVEFVDGFISDLSVTIPWANLLTESCFFSISGLTITLQVKKRANPAQISASIFHSMCESFSSFSVAEECMKAENVQASPGKSRSKGTEEDIVAGVELLAQAIDSVIMRVQVKLLDSTIRLEYMPGLEQRGIALELQVGKIIYSGETGPVQQQEQFTTSTVRKIFLEDIGLLTDEFSLVNTMSPCTSLHGSRYNSKSPNKERKLSGDSDVSNDTIHDMNSDPAKDNLDPPLHLATLAGRHELVLKFTEMNQFGLPRAVDEVEIGLGRLSFHIYPHQVHILSEIASAVTVPPKPTAKQPRQQKHLMMGLEGLLQENLKLGAGGLIGQQGLNVGWGDREMEASREFMPVSGLATISRSQGFLTDEKLIEQQPSQPPMPRILVRVASCVGVLHMRDPGIIKLGGEPTKALAMLAMRTSADSFFSSQPNLPAWEERKLSTWHHNLGRSIGSSHLQLLASPVTVVYEEGTSIGPGLSSNYAAMTTVTLGKVSVIEHLVDTCNSQQPDLIHLLKFSHQDCVSSKKNPDIKLVYKDTYELGETVPTSTLCLSLNSCIIDMDPGIVDRTYLLLNYSDLDPECVRTVTSSSTSSPSNITVTVTSPTVSLAFHIPKPDMRNPHDIGPEFIRTFWTRKVHPEIFLIQLEEFSLKVSQEGGSLEPLCINLSSATVEINYKESVASTPFPIIQARRLGEVRDRNKKSFAIEIDITVCMDDSLKLQGKFNSRQQKMEKSVLRKKSSGSPDEMEYFVVDPDSGFGNDSGSRPGFLQQQEDILAALKQAAVRNNLLLDIKLDAVSLVMPSKTLYEVIYNRLGNDMLLWLPQYMAVKEHLYGEAVFDPLHDDTQEFSGCFSGRREALPLDPPPRPKNTTAFPKDRQTGALEIHTDTSVVLSCNQVQLLVCVPMDTDTDTLGLLHISAVGLHLIAAVGLDKDPEISIFTLKCGEGCVKYGLCAKTSLPSQLHFNPTLPGLSVLLTTNSYCDRAWPNRVDKTDLLNLTAKILLDTTSNLKSIQLAFKLVQVGLCVRDPNTGPDWVNALVDFFTVVEFPVLGYQPPAVLTEMHFQLVQCGLELAPPNIAPVRAALCIGKVGISCSLLDTTADASVAISVEDAAVYLSKDSLSPIDTAVCVTDIDYLDLSVTLSEPEQGHFLDQGTSSPGPGAIEPTLLVTASANLVRVRTCADTLQLLAELGAGLGSTVEQEVNQDLPEEGNDATLGQQSDDMLPDLEDAMVELSHKKDSPKEKDKGKPPSTGQGAQVFFFPGENCPLPPNYKSQPDLMTQSIYLPQSSLDMSDEESSDLESFCILEEEEGSGIIPSGGGPSVRSLMEGVSIVDNHFNVPQAVIDHLKSPKGFPLPQMKLSLTKMSLVWQIFGGNDFSSSKEMRHNTKAKLEQMGLSLTNEGLRQRRTLNVNNGVGSAIAAADSLKTRGGPGRNGDLLIEIVVSKMAAQHEVYPLTGEANSPVTRQIVLLPNFEIRDKLAGSEINKLLHGYSSKTRPRQSSAHMLHIKSLTVKPDPTSQLEETSLKISLQPFRLNIDQDTLFFIIDFANTLVPPQVESELGKSPSPSPSPGPGQSIKFSSGMQAIQIEVPEGAEVFEDAQSSPPKSPPTETELPPSSTPHSKSSTPGPNSSSPGNIYFKSFIFSPAVPIRVDYVGKYVDLTQGALTGILAGLAQLNCSELTLKQLELKQGILGLDKLLATAATAWLADIRSSQLPALLGGVGPMHAFLQLLLGIRDLVLLPIEQYRKDGRIVRGLQKGTTSFTHSTTLSFLDVTNKFLTVIKFAAELAFDVMSPDGCVVYGKLPHPARDCKRKAGRSQVRRARGTPADFREGMLGAMQLVREGLDETARSLAEAAGDRTGMAGAVGGVLRAVPSTMVRPVILGAAATSNLLDGVKNQISPDQRAEEEDKWRTHQHS